MSLLTRVAANIPVEVWKAVFIGGAAIGFMTTLAAIQKIRVARRNEQLRARAK